MTDLSPVLPWVILGLVLAAWAVSIGYRIGVAVGQSRQRAADLAQVPISSVSNAVAHVLAAQIAEQRKSAIAFEAEARSRAKGGRPDSAVSTYKLAITAWSQVREAATRLDNLALDESRAQNDDPVLQ